MTDWIQHLHKLWQWESQLILWLQSQTPLFVESMRWVSELGHPPAMLTLILITYWGWKDEAGIQLAKFLTLSGLVMCLLKDFILAPRPFWIHPDVQALGSAGGYGMPSGHAMMACVWLIVLVHTQHAGLKLWSIAVILATGMSRVTLGVHSPLQVLAGWLIGSCVFVWIRMNASRPGAEKAHKSADLMREMIVLMLLGGMTWFVYQRLVDWSVPESWIEMSVDKTSEAKVPSVPNPRSAVFYLSLSIGLALWHWVRAACCDRLKPGGSLIQRFARVSTGLVLGGGVYYLYKKSNINAQLDPHLMYAVGAVGCFMSTFLLVLGFPWLFQTMGMAPKASSRE